MTKNIAILGSTGSIGKNALKVIDSLGEEYRVLALTAHSSAQLLAAQCKLFNPKYIALTEPNSIPQLKEHLGSAGPEIIAGPDALADIACLDEVDIVIAAVVGAAGLPAILSAAAEGKTLAIANKEPLVIAGKMLTQVASRSNATILPVDSEHSAIFQCLHGQSPGHVQKIILTGSGGPFRNYSAPQLADVSVTQALNHPTWDMGPKITIDSATLMNKALEVIEAVWLFNTPPEKIEVLIHPESIIHSMVEFIDGSVIAQMGAPDMCTPIQYALTYPDRQKGVAQHLDFSKISSFTFHQPDMNVFRALKLGYQVARQEGTAPVIFNAANEAAVCEFLSGKINFTDIIELIEHCLNIFDHKDSLSLEQLLQADKWARKEVIKCSSQKVR